MNTFSNTISAVSCGYHKYTLSLADNNSIIIEFEHYPISSKIELCDLTSEQMRKLSEMFLLRAIELESK